MKILSVESSGLTASTAIMSDGILVGEYTIHNKKTHSQTLLPMISDLLEMAEISPAELDAIAVSAGPGSFTGLRIGASTAKGLAWTFGIPIVPVSSLMGLAANIQEAGKLVCPIMDARRNQTYFGIYRITEGLPEIITEPDVEEIGSVISRINAIGEEITFLGDGVPVFEMAIREQAECAVKFAAPKDRYQRGVSVASLGEFLFEQKKFVRAEEFVPVYLRKSQAERERMEKSS
ncbi:MAG: tRNA (adenosine(37)-N6)-threonylcarbamoyltransferase complex dimerization subunit type 1 TsaB [Roseburia sp.]|nr:tRNA (adenosine(37)-N6)-threonylcarbamoyltransferase complex dimerization subunit type 1 TsaB [Roseburia sp.]